MKEKTGERFIPDFWVLLCPATCQRLTSTLAKQFEVSQVEFTLGVVICPDIKIERIRGAAHNLPHPSSTKCCSTALEGKIFCVEGCGYSHYFF